MAARWLGNCCGPNPRSRRSEPAPAIPATRRQALGTRTGFRAEALRYQKLHIHLGGTRVPVDQIRDAGPWKPATAAGQQRGGDLLDLFDLHAIRYREDLGIERELLINDVPENLSSASVLPRYRPGPLWRSGREQKQLRIADYYLVCGSGLALKDWAFLHAAPFPLKYASSRPNSSSSNGSFTSAPDIVCSPANMARWQLNVGRGSTKCRAVFLSRFTIHTSGSLMIIRPWMPFSGSGCSSVRRCDSRSCRRGTLALAAQRNCLRELPGSEPDQKALSSTPAAVDHRRWRSAP